MTTKYSIKYGVVMALLLWSTSLFAQEQTSSDVSFSIPEVALIDIEPSINNTIYFEIGTATESGTKPVISNAINETLWINYTSAQNSNGARSISAGISSGSVPSGIDIYVRASAYSGIGEGVKFGNRTGRKKLVNNPRKIITSIRNCCTGDGIGNGHLLTFTMEISKLEDINSVSNANFVVTYTLTDN